jgi:hypothetical protein
MPEQEQHTGAEPQPLSVGVEKFSKLIDNFRESGREYLAYCSKAFENASDLNKRRFLFTSDCC